MTNRSSYTIGQLAKLAGVTTRTIRYYIAERLLPPPQHGGQAERYDDDHLRRLELIRRLKAEFLPLAEIRSRLGALDPQAIQELADEARLADGMRPVAETRSPAEGQPSAGRPLRLAEKQTAQEYLRTLLHPESEASPLLRDTVARRAQGAGAPGREEAPPRSEAALPNRGAAYEELSALDAGRLFRHAPVHGEIWQRFDWHPDIEIQVRQPPRDPRLRARLAALLRQLQQLIDEYTADDQEVTHG